MKFLKFIPFVFFAGLIFQSAFGQTMQAKSYNFQTFQPTFKDITEELDRLTPDAFQSHPEYGQLPFNAPCENCYELIHLRSDSTRMFVEKGSEGTKFYSQAAYGKLHYMDENGYLRAYDPRLKKTAGTDHTFESLHQDFPLELNAGLGQTTLHLPNNQIIRFNNELTLMHVSESGITTNLGAANWSTYSAGSEGVKVENAWPGIDIEIKVGLGEIKTDYVIKSNPGFADGYLVIIDHLEADDNFVLQMDEISETNVTLGTNIGTVRYMNPDGEGVLIGSAFGYDQSGDKTHTENFGYKIENDELGIWIPVSWINDPAKIFPLVIDPSVTSSATYTAGIMRFRYNGSFCAGPNADCGYVLTVPRPANSTLTGANFSIVQETLNGFCFGCWMSEAGFYFQTTCGVDGYWGCNVNNPGTCTGTNLDFSPLVTCLGPACNGNVDFTIFNSYCYCSTGGVCGSSCQRINNNTWVITIIGSTVETLGDVATGNGSQTINDPDCIGTATLDPTAANGVPGYTYNWSTGETSSTINVAVTPAVYTCTVTDACGVAVVATFNVGCPLPVRLNLFTAKLIDNKSYLNWETLNETGVEKFRIEKADASGNFTSIYETDPSGNTGGASYEFIDPAPFDGISYYRLVMVFEGNEIEYSEVVSVFKDSDGISIVPNPGSGIFSITFNSEPHEKINLEIIGSTGIIVYQESFESTGEVTVREIDLRNQTNGVYTIRIFAGDKIYSEKLIIR